MLRDLTIDGFRGFEHFEMCDLGRVNLLVGTNNSGKTSVLEAIQMLTTGHMRSIWGALSRRGERLVDESDRRLREEVDVCHLFHGHAMEVGSEFRLSGVNDLTGGSLTATIQERPFDEDSQSPLFEEEEDYTGPLGLLLKGEGFVRVDEKLPLSRRGGLSSDVTRRLRSTPDESMLSTRYITTASMSPDEIVSLYENVVLKPEEDRVIQALKTIEPTIERIATTSKGARFSRGYPGERGGIVVKCAGVDQRIPIGSLGDGIWRMLGLALALVHAENGVLLVDEIDTGLHFGVMSDMWKLVSETAIRLNVQVFATTHSGDAVDSLAAISRADVSEGSDVTIQRLERDEHRAVAYNEQEIVVAAERGTEVR
ncbi:MAG: ATP-binding protein [Candidatus Thermoplasmatota archaeon]|nr:ATP-binding protein [Candidatus Thermoplasmatota archaeon]